MLSSYLERFVRRVVGRWVRNFTGDIALNGRISFLDLWLETGELRNMVLPFEILDGHVGRVSVDLNFSSIRIEIDDVDLLVEAQDYDIDDETARRAVETAVNLYFTNYLRDGEAPTLDLRSFIDSAELAIRRVHLRIRTPLPLQHLGDGAGESRAWGVIMKSLTMEKGQPKTATLEGVAVYVGGEEDSDDDAMEQVKAMRSVWRELPQADDWFSTEPRYEVVCDDKAVDIAKVIISATATIDAASISQVSPVLSSATFAAFTPWVSHFDEIRLHVDGVKIRSPPELPKLILDAIHRLERSHAARQEAATKVIGVRRELLLNPISTIDDDEDPRARRSFEVEGSDRQSRTAARLWAVVRASIQRDFWRGKRRWRRWFQEWRQAAAYVAARRALHGNLRWGVVKTRGEAYYELHETCAVTRGGQFYVHPRAEIKFRSSRENYILFIDFFLRIF